MNDYPDAQLFRLVATTLAIAQRKGYNNAGNMLDYDTTIMQRALLHASAESDLTLKTPALVRGSLSGQKLGKYTLGRLLGGGRYAEIYRARSNGSEESPVAIKTVSEDYFDINGGAAPQARRALEREACISDRVWTEMRNRNPFMHSALLQVDLEAPRPYLVLRGARLGSLEKHSAALLGNAVAIATLFAPLACDLATMHSLSIGHFDIKPMNILLFRTEFPQSQVERGTVAGQYGLFAEICDFGSAAWYGELGRVEPEQTDVYASPEQRYQTIDDSHAVGASDVFSFGLTLHNLLTGSVENADSAETLALNVIGKHDHAFSDMRLVIQNCVLDPPGDRPTAQELHQYLCAIAQREPLPRRKLRIALGMTRRRALGLTAAAAGAIGAAGFWGFSELERRRRNERHARKLEGARRLAGSGNWGGALPIYEGLVADPICELPKTDLRTERLNGLWAVGDYNEFTSEVARLSTVGFTNPRIQLAESIVAHSRGDLLACRILTESALQDRDKLVASDPFARDGESADVFFAEAIIAEGPTDSVKKLWSALAINNQHFPSLAALPIALLADGVPDEAQRAADELRHTYPRSPVAPFVGGIIAALDGDSDIVEAGESLDELAQTVESHQFSRFLTCLGSVTSCDAAAAAKPDYSSLADTVVATFPKAALLSMAAETLNEDHERSAARAFRFPLLYSFPHLFNRLQLGAVFPPSTASDVAIIRQSAARTREAIPSIAEAKQAFDAAARAVAKQDLKRFQRLTADAVSSAYAAAERPTLFSRTLNRYKSRMSGLVAELVLLTLFPSEVDRLRSVNHQWRLGAQDETFWPRQRDEVVRMIIAAIIEPRGAQSELLWQKAENAGSHSWLARCERLNSFGRACLSSLANGDTEPPRVTALRRELDSWIHAQRN